MCPRLATALWCRWYSGYVLVELYLLHFFSLFPDWSGFHPERKISHILCCSFCLNGLESVYPSSGIKEIRLMYQSPQGSVTLLLGLFTLQVITNPSERGWIEQPKPSTVRVSAHAPGQLPEQLRTFLPFSHWSPILLVCSPCDNDRFDWNV